MKLSVVIPVWNEVNTIKKLMNIIFDVDLNKEIIIVDDGSTDGTRELIKKDYGKRKDVKVILHEKNKGKGSAIRNGLKHATGDIVIIQDADLEYDPRDYPKLVQPIINGETEVVYGSRFLNRKNKYFFSMNLIATKILNLMANILYNAKITDEPTCYKVFSKKAIDSVDLKCKGFEFCPEVTAKIRKNGYKIKEIPISYKPRSKKEGKKIRCTDGMEAIWTLLKYRFIK